MTVNDACPNCGGEIAQFRGIEAGHIFVLGTHYSAKMGATFLDEKGEKQTLVMGCYGIGVSRLVAAIVEQHRDANGISWPAAAAPYKVHLCQLGDRAEVVAAVAQIESELLAAGIEPLVDDRDIRPGVKFKDADLIGLPYRITVGDRGLANGKVELKARTEANPKASEEFALSAISQVVTERIKKELSDS
jgi:prolyl-tRNA synthetase